MNTEAHARVTAASLRRAADAVAELGRRKIAVLGHYHNGRKPVLLVERQPQFVKGALKRRQPSPCGVEHVYAAPFLGCQIEWTLQIPAVQEVGHA